MSEFLLGLGSTLRLTRLATRDEILRPARESLTMSRSPVASTLGVWMTCPWCVSIWAAAAVWLGRLLLPDRIWRAGASALSASFLVGVVAGREHPFD